MSLTRTLAALTLAAGLLAACGSDDAAPSDTSAPGVTTTETTSSGVTEPGATTTGTDGTTTGTDGTTATTGTGTTSVTLEQAAIWPAPDVVYATPEEAAESFVTEVLAVPVNLGEFQQGDARSGEMEVLFTGEGSSGPAISRSLLLLRQLGPDSGWFVTAAVNPNAAVTSPSCCPADPVPAGPLTVEGEARGFEGAVTITAYDPTDPANPLDTVLTQGGSLAEPTPFTETVDLSGAAPGSTVVLLVRGGVGLETDPGDFGAIALTIAP